MINDLISREYVKLFVCEYEKFNGKETEIVKAVPIIAIDNAPTVSQIIIFCENADEKTIADMKEELQKVMDLRPQGEWGKWVVSEIRCPKCLEYYDSDCYSKEELNKCPNCGADMRKGDDKNDT